MPEALHTIPPQKPLDVIVYGTVCLDQFVRVEETGDVVSGEFEERPGGEAFNTATALVGWGVQVLLTGTALGSDTESDRLRTALDTSPLGVSRDFLPDVPNAVTPVCTVRVTPDGERFMSGRGFAQAVPPPPLPDVVFAGRPVFATDPNLGRAGIVEALRAATLGCPIVAMDLSHVPEIVTVSRIVQESQERLHRLGITATPETWAEHQIAVGAETAILTRGQAGCVVADRTEGVFTVPAFAVSNVVDTTGAGDTFRAGLCYGLVQAWPIRETVRFASAAAALHCQVWGGGSRILLGNVQRLASSGRASLNVRA